ncbi:hypothetical protein [Persephonella sp.]
MLTENEKRFVNQRIKLGNIANRFIVIVIFSWIIIYGFVFVKFPYMVNPTYFKSQTIEINDERIFLLIKLTPVFFNLFMIVLLLLFILMLVFLNVERDYIKIIKKLMRRKKASTKEAEN